MYINKRYLTQDIVFDIVIYIVLSIAALITLYPIVYAVSCSLSNPQFVASGQIYFLPREFTIVSYENVLKNNDIWQGYRNTIIYALLGTCINLIMTVLAAYPLSRSDLKGGKLILWIILLTMYFQGGMIPTYIIIKELGMLNSLWALVIPNAINTYNLIVTRTYFQTNIPKELLESAFIDGSSNTKFLLKVVLPVSGPIIAVIALFYSVGHWNDFFSALIYITKRKLYPLQLVLREILIQSQIDEMASSDKDYAQRLLQSEGIKYAVIVIASLPMLILYPFIQRYFVKGVMVGSIKG